MLFLNACGKESVPYAYQLSNEVSNFRIVQEQSTSLADSFASGLCVTAVDVFDNTDVDMTRATAAGLFDLNNQKVIYAKNIHERLYPASLTKVMTALVALKYGNPDDIITVTSDVNITESGAQLCGLKEGDTLTLNQALHALLIDSANDAAAAIAVHVGGSMEGFADMMNAEAIAIGATNSHFVNPHGLSDDNHYVTAYDMYLIFSEAIKYDKFNEIIQMSEYKTIYSDSAGNDKEMSFESTNRYLRGTETAPEQITVMGGKTGTTNAAGNCLIIFSKDTSDNAYISVILRSDERDIIYSEMTDLLNEINN